ncbi:MAG: M42 family metallopeptidase [Anaerolineae bacterium]|nr:M42 family metallopeptidase [Anaerolineae bacterium]MDW8173409.1 M42 family metallopeptidase [Anaerolineae bacterium]
MYLRELSQAVGVSGDEGAVRDLIVDAIRDHVTDLHIDALGSLTARLAGTGAQPLRIMLDAHMDEVGFMITGVESNGLLRFTAVGGIDDRILPALRVLVGKKQIPGVILWAPIHHNRDQSIKPIKELRIDIGASSKSAAEGKVSLGDRVAFASEYVELSETVVRGKAFDDRVGCSLLIDVLRSGPYPVEVLVSFTVQEEIGLRGAKVAAQRLQPDLAIALEGTTAHDVPNPSADPDDPTRPNPVCVMGGGPALTLMDRSLIAHPRLLAFLRQTAEDVGIPYQYKRALGGGTNAGAIHLANAGVPSAVISIPCRYIHSPHALLSKADYAAALRLIQAALHRLTPDVLQPASA